MINYGRGLCNIILPEWEGHNILFPSFTFIFSLREGLCCTTPDWPEGPAQLPELNWPLTLPGMAGSSSGRPSQVSGSLFSWTQFPFPLLLLRCQGSSLPHVSPSFWSLHPMVEKG